MIIIKSYMRLISLFAILLAFRGGCQAQEIPVSTPSEQGLNEQVIEELVEIFSNEKPVPNRHSLLIVKNGYLVTEEYFNGSSDKLHMLQSVTKSFTSAAIGIAIEKGYIEGVEAKVLEFFTEMNDISNLDDRKRSMALKDILTMRTGTDYHEQGPDSPHFQLNALRRDWDSFYLNRPMVCEPGTKYQYDSGGVILLSAILKMASGKHADEFLEENLFMPLGIEKKWWIKNLEGHPHTGGGLLLRPRDMAKFGLLYLQKGKWNGKQLVPEWWVNESFEKKVDFGAEGRGHETGYGYLWWIQEPDENKKEEHVVYSARGAFGQYIFIIPDHDMLVVVTANTKGEVYEHPVDFIYSHILPSCH